MVSALSLLMETELTPAQKELTNIMEESGTVLLKVVNDILDFSKLANGGFSISSDLLNIRETIESVVRNYQVGSKIGTKVEAEFDAKLPVAVEGDQLRFRQVVQNLVSNAIKFTEEGSVRVRASVQEENLNDYVLLTEVIDTGIGIPENATNLFIPFTQYDNSTTKRYQGTGLGLSICKNLANLMGGEAGFKPNPGGKGSVFWFTVKMKRVPKTAIVEKLRQSISTLKLDPKNVSVGEMHELAKGKRVLLAEDNMINRKVMTKMLQNAGFNNIDMAENGQLAAELAIRDPYDIVLMDINMPILDGVAATRKIRDAGVSTPIIAMTANALKGHAEAYLSKGMDFYIPKPVDRSLLLEGLLRCLKPNEERSDEP